MAGRNIEEPGNNTSNRALEPLLTRLALSSHGGTMSAPNSAAVMTPRTFTMLASTLRDSITPEPTPPSSANLASEGITSYSSATQHDHESSGSSRSSLSIPDAAMIPTVHNLRNQIQQQATTSSSTSSIHDINGSSTDSLSRTPSNQGFLLSSHITLAGATVGLRDIAKKIGKAVLQWTATPNTILIVTKIHDAELVAHTLHLAQWLLELGLDVLVEDRFQETQTFISLQQSLTELSSLPSIPSMTPPRQPGRLRFWNAEYCKSAGWQEVDLIVTLGGDGTVLFTAGLFSGRRVPPLVPFDLGSLGFLAVFDFAKVQDILGGILFGCVEPQQSKISPETEFLSLALTDPVHSDTPSYRTSRFASDTSANTPGVPAQSPVPLSIGGFVVNMRMRLACTIWRHPKEPGGRHFKAETFHVLNELVVDRGPSPYMSQIELFLDDAHLTSMQADGLVVATPTGSTAYSLSANGSMVHPAVPTILVTPICPHTLSFRPMLLPDSVELKILVPVGSRTATAWAAFDGRNRLELAQGDYISVTMSRFPVPTVCAVDQSKDWVERSLENSLNLILNCFKNLVSVVVCTGTCARSRKPSLDDLDLIEF